MFTNLDFLKIGEKWTPTNSVYLERQENYVTGRQLYEGEFEKVFKEAWQSIASRYGQNYDKIEQVMIKLNLFKALTETFKILAFQKEPEIWVGNETKDEKLEDFYPRRKTLDLLKKAFVSCHAQGEAVLKVYINSDNKPDISVISPENWIPIYNPENLDEITAHVVANTYKVNNESNYLGVSVNSEITYLNVEIHYKGYYEKRLYKLDKHNVIQKLENQEKIKTNYDGFTVFPFNYGTPSWRDYGKSAYAEITPIVDEIVTRLSNNSKILDDHADPQLIVPRESLEFDQDSGEWVYKRHMAAIGFGKNGEVPQYLTWDGNLQSSENQINKVMDLFYLISGTNPQLFGQDIAGNLSGEALAKILIIPIAKTREMLLSLEDAFESAFNCLLKAQGVDKTVEIEFEVGQFNSQSDITARVVQEKNAGITSLARAVQEINPRYTEEEVMDEVNLINKDRQSESMTDLNSLFPNDSVEDEQE